MLVKVEDGFYLNSQHIIAIRISKDMNNGAYVVIVEYTPNSLQSTGLYQKAFTQRVDAEAYLQTLHKSISKH